MSGNYSNVSEIPLFIAADGTRAELAGRMINFETAQFQLQPDHKAWIEDQVLPAIMERPNPWVDIYGYASRKGNQDFNLKLSEQRANAVKDYLTNQLIIKNYPYDKIKKIIQPDHGFGEDDPANLKNPESDNSGFWRAAQLTVFGSKPTLVRVRKPRLPLLSHKKWSARINFSYMFSIGVAQVGIAFYEFRNEETMQSRVYFSPSFGVGKSMDLDKIFQWAKKLPETNLQTQILNILTAIGTKAPSLDSIVRNLAKSLFSTGKNMWSGFKKCEVYIPLKFDLINLKTIGNYSLVYGYKNQSLYVYGYIGNYTDESGAKKTGTTDLLSVDTGGWNLPSLGISFGGGPLLML